MMRLPLQRRILVGAAILLFSPLAAGAAVVTLQWDASPDPAVIGYYVHMGTEAGVYNQRFDAGLVTSYTVTIPDGTRVHFGVQAYTAAGLVSAYSNDARFLPFLPGYSWDRYGVARPTIYWQHRVTASLATWTMDRWMMVEGNGVTPSQPSEPGWQIVATTDFDGDGGLDLMWRHITTGQLAGWRMAAQVMLDGFLFSPSREADMNWEVRSVQDMTGDGYPDLVWQNRSTGALRIWAMFGANRLATFVPTPSSVTSTATVLEGAGDFDGDHNPDLLFRNSSTGLISIWLMDRLSRRSVVNVATNSSPLWVVSGVMDIDADGSQDVLWQHLTEGTLAAWLMSGTTLWDGLLLSPSRVSDTNWRMISTR